MVPVNDVTRRLSKNNCPPAHFGLQTDSFLVLAKKSIGDSTTALNVPHDGLPPISGCSGSIGTQLLEMHFAGVPAGADCESG